MGAVAAALRPTRCVYARRADARHAAQPPDQWAGMPPDQLTASHHPGCQCVHLSFKRLLTQTLVVQSSPPVLHPASRGTLTWNVDVEPASVEWLLLYCTFLGVREDELAGRQCKAEQVLLSEQKGWRLITAAAARK